METGFLNFHDGEHFSSLPSPLYDQDILDDSESSLLDLIHEDFPYSSSGQLQEPQGLWDTEQELNGDIAVLPISGPIESHVKEDFHKMLLDWHQHLGSLQVSDTEDLDAVGLDMAEVFPAEMPDNIFDGSLDCGDTGLGLGGPLGLQEQDEDCIDVETVPEQMPVLEAGDLKSLLEQFEASEAFNSSKTSSAKPSVLDQHLYNMATQRATPPKHVPVATPTKPVTPPRHVPVTPTTKQAPMQQATHQNIRDSLPREVIDRIKASGRKKVIPLIPAMPSKKLGRGATRMQDAVAALNRNKLLKLVSGNAGESVQLDHDYCGGPQEPGSAPPRPFYNSDASDYVGPAANCWEKNARKDSGLESGDVSDAETASTTDSLSSGSSGARGPTLISVLKKSVPVSVDSTCPKKRKLNLAEYRSRARTLTRTPPMPEPMLEAPMVANVGTCTSEDSDASVRVGTITPSAFPPPDPEQRGMEEEPPSKEETLGGDDRRSVGCQTGEEPAAQQDNKEKKAGRTRDLKHRQYRSRRAESSGSSSSSSSLHRRRAENPPRSRHSPHRRSKGHSASSSGSKGRSFWSRSRSRSSSRSSSCSSDRLRSRSGQGEATRRARSSWKHGDSRRTSKSWNRSRSPGPSLREKQRQVEERRVIYVGRIEEGTSKAELRHRFEAFGPIVDISVHFREHGDNYGFVTFAYKVDAYAAVERGNDDPKQPRYELCFGGRRAFCKTRYADLDGLATNRDQRPGGRPHPQQSSGNDSFDLLLREAQAKLRKRKV